ncbi:MarR family winged helix-turn-helix transcriptional regulator [Pseudalkalibacillus salsuginis]|uniref:MarR family winged helix-turn-helix transcriptional regulator n=1 Tax=Pseudalkalibacillus salsuginis TaxID=2910972 RepID=UPI001F410D57|nr:MarR family transcriptional regulator [Pseudalkalibacillus salsuginis]MCF6409621.1 MarR family transcriptional regulator [Pseudalkalibacillus salsuginis]
MIHSNSSKPDQNHLAVDVVHVLIKTNHYFNREFEKRLSSLEMPITLSGSRLRVLTMVGKMGEIRMSQLAEKLGVQAGTVTDLVDALQRDKLISRVPDPKDRRAMLLKLTEKAEKHLEPIHVIQSELAEKMLKRFSPEQRYQLIHLLEGMMDNLNLD